MTNVQKEWADKDWEAEFDYYRDSRGGWPSRTECFEEFFLPNLKEAQKQAIASHNNSLVEKVDRLPVYYRPIQLKDDDSYSKRDESATIIEMYSKEQIDELIKNSLEN